jgi:hypothetical protein
VRKSAATTRILVLPSTDCCSLTAAYAGRPYGSVADLLKVSGIGPMTLKKLEPYLKVEKK